MASDSNSPSPKALSQLLEELDNFQEIARFLNPSPGELPRVAGIDVASLSMPYRQVVGGDHVIYVDFAQRFDLAGRIERARRDGREQVARRLEQLSTRAGILVVDVSGHRMTDAMVAAMLHQAFLLGIHYELDQFGEVTTKLFEHLNTRFYRTTAINKYFTMIYGEISERGTFRFLSAGHQPPAVFSREFGRIVPIGHEHLVSFPPVGLLPSGSDEKPEPSVAGYKRDYEVNEISLLSHGDILLLSTDGLNDHMRGDFFPDRVETLLREHADETAAGICQHLREAILDAGEPEDDLTVVVIKRDLTVESPASRTPPRS